MTKYRVNVNGTVYEIELEKLESTDAVPQKAEQKAAPAPAPKPAAPAAPAAAAPAAAAPAGGETVNSPMPGTILAVNVAAGDTVKKGQVLMVLEAMKMENEIMSPVDGRIASGQAAKGASVETGAVLCVIS